MTEFMTFERAKQEFIEDFNKIKNKKYKTNRISGKSEKINGEEIPV